MIRAKIYNDDTRYPAKDGFIIEDSDGSSVLFYTQHGRITYRYLTTHEHRDPDGETRTVYVSNIAQFDSFHIEVV